MQLWKGINGKNVKISSIILLYVAFITVAFVVMVCAFSFSTSNGVADDLSYNTVGVYVIQQNALTYTNQDGTAVVDIKNGTPISEYNGNFLTLVLSGLWPFTIGFCIVLLVSSYLLWFVLNHVQRKNDLKTVMQLNHIQDEYDYCDDNPVLNRAYDTIRQKFEDSMQDYQRLNSYLSHEQKNAIAILRTSLELTGDTEHLDSLDYITDSINDVLTLSEPSNTNKCGIVDVALVCAEVCDNYSKVTDKISFCLDETENTEIYAKERWIYRAVANLVSNAIKYGKNKPITVGVRNRKNSVIVTVEDFGIGIPAEQQEKIFNHRYRINELNKDGYGIGLSLVSHVCDLCGGFACVESEENVGSKFYLSFPHFSGK